MRILFLARSTLYNVFGGDTVQIVSTAKYLRELGVSVDVKLSDEQIDYRKYDLMHIFNIGRPADIIRHINSSGLPYVVSTIFVDFSEYQKLDKSKWSFITKYFSNDNVEYLKAIGRWIKNGEKIQSREYLYYGHKRAVQYVADGASYLLPNSESEYKRFMREYRHTGPYKVVYNGIDPELFHNRYKQIDPKDPLLVLCVARIEGRKNQLNLITALNNTRFRLKIIGKPAPNHISYYNACRKAAAGNVSFEDFMSQEQLVKEYRSAKVHVLPSWGETCGLSSVEAACNHCSIVITDKGDTVEYFGDDAMYCDPADPVSIYRAVVRASEKPVNENLLSKINSTYTWQSAAINTLSVYREILNEKTLQKSIKIQELKAAKYAEQLKVTF